ncbi:MAG: flagellar hook-length control protein FliK [Magnetococcales bacterium]|nr:flagellar hook-length control protein FliK [Magnetococcales bacterium]
MIISGLLLPSGDTAASVKLPRVFSQGESFTARVSRLDNHGQGLMRLPDGHLFSFSGAKGLSEGEQVRLEVVRTAPELTFRLAGTQSQAASQLAESAEQSLVRAPDVFARLIAQAGLAKGGMSGEALLFSLKNAGQPFLVTDKGETLAGLLQKNLPNISGDALLRGNGASLAKLLEGGSRQDVADAIRNLQLAAGTLRLGGEESAGMAGKESAAAELAATRGALQRLGDLLAMQEILPRTPAADGQAFPGYRLFWLTEGGLGEAIWRQSGGKKGGRGEADNNSILVSLNMTHLGSVQARLELGERQLMVSIAAEDEQALSALRGQVGQLRTGIQEIGLPLKALELSRLTRAGMREARQQLLGLAGSGFSARA